MLIEVLQSIRLIAGDQKRNITNKAIKASNAKETKEQLEQSCHWPAV